MPRIPRYEQDGLASSMVGTPGVDTSAAEGLTSLANDAQSVEKVVLDTAEGQYQQTQKELARKQAEQRELDKQMANAKRATAVSAQASTFNRTLNDLDNQKRTQYMHDTTGMADDFQESAEKLLENQSKGIPDELTRQEFMTRGNGMIGEYGKQNGDWGHQQDIKIATASVSQIADDFAVTLNDGAKDLPEVKLQLDNFEKNYQAYYLVYGDEARKIMRRDKEEGIKNYLADTAVRFPDLLDERINAFGNVLDAKDKQSFYSSVRRAAADAKAEQEANDRMKTKATQIDAINELYSLSPTGNPADVPLNKLQAWRNKYKTVMTPGLAATAGSLDNKVKVSQAKQAQKQAQTQDDTTIAGHIGQQINQVNTSAAEVQRLWVWANEKTDPAEKKKRITTLERATDKYMTQYSNLRALAATLKDPAAKSAANVHINNIRTINGQIVGSLNKDARAADEIRNISEYQNRVGHLTVYADARRNAVFQYYWNLGARQMYSEVMAKGKGDRLQNPKWIQGFRMNLKKYAVEQVEKMKFTNGQ